MTALIVAIVIILVLAAAAGAFFVLGRRDTRDAVGTLSAETKSRDRAGRRSSTALATTEGSELVEWTPPTEAEIGVDRRQFLNRGILALTSIGVAGTGGVLLSFLWPTASGGFGSKLSLGKISDLKQKIQDGNGFHYIPEGKLFVTDYPASALSSAEAVYQAPVMAALKEGVAVLYQKCPHLGCRVPWCDTSQWFECPCHGSQYNAAGEKKTGPAPRGLDHFASEVSGGVLSADTGTIVQGAPIGTDTTGQEAAGPHCVSAGE